MNSATAALDFLNQPIVQRLGWTLVHSLWQGVLVAAALAAMLRLLRTAPANVRYIASCCAMAMLLATAAMTFGVLRGEVHDPFHSSTSDELPARLAPMTAMPPATSNLALPPNIANPPSDPAQRDLKWIVLAWAIGVLAMSIWHVGGWLLLGRLRSGGEPLHAWEPAVNKLRDRLGIRRAVAIIETARIDVPAVIGALRPIIVVPIGVFSGLSPQQVEAILAHELAHIRRHDYLVNLIQSAIETLLFYHPATWWISTQIRRERENCCDDIAAAVCGSDRDYAAALAALEERRGSVRIAMAATGGSVMERVRRVLHLPPAKSHTSRIHSLAAALLAIGLIVFPLACVGRAKGQSPASSAATQPAAATAEHQFIDVVIGKESLLYQGKPIDWTNLEKLLDAIPAAQRSKTVLAVAAASPDVTVERYFSVSGQLSNLVKTRGLAYLSDTGIHPTTEPVADSSLPPGTETGEYYVDGHVQRSGVYSLTGRKISVKQAIIAAGGLDQGTTDGYIELIRRIGRDHEEFPMRNVSVNELMDQKVKDLFLKPNDILRISLKKIDYEKLDAARKAAANLPILDPPPENKRNGEYYIGGEVERGGVYSLSDLLSVKQALAAAAGIKDPKAASKLAIIIIRRDDQDQEHVAMDKVPVADIFEGRHADMYVWPNDVIRVVVKDGMAAPGSATQPASAAPAQSNAETGEYYMSGVKRSGIYSLTGRKVTLKQALMAAGGTELPFSHVARITIVRREGDKETDIVKDLPLDDLTDGKVQDLYLQPSDMIMVKPESGLELMELGELFKQRHEVVSEIENMQRKVGPNSPRLAELNEQRKQLEAHIIKLGGEGWLNDGATTTKPTPATAPTGAAAPPASTPTTGVVINATRPS